MTQHSAVSLVSLLPRPVAPVPESSFDDELILLLAGVAHADGFFSYERYRLVQEICRQLFDEQALQAKLQAKLHYALLHPPVADTLTVQAETLVTTAEQEGVPSSRLMALSQAVRRILTPETADSQTAPPSTPSASELLAVRLEAILRPAPVRPGNAGMSIDADPSFVNDMERGLRWLCRTAAKYFSSGGETSVNMPAAAPVPDSLSSPLEQLERIARSLNDRALCSDLNAFGMLLPAQDFRIVVAGEQKRGKSSLINALLGQTLAPVREVLPETTAVTVFHQAPRFKAVVRVISSEELNRLEQALHVDPDNVILARKLDRLRRALAENNLSPGRILELSTPSELLDYLRSDGKRGGLVTQADVGLPSFFLGEGTTLVDTPALNATDTFSATLAAETGLTADCLLFVMDARNPVSRSELELLRKLACMGRNVTIVGVLACTGHPLESATLEASRELARLALQEACKSTGLVEPAGVLAINLQPEAKTASAVTGEFATLLTLLREAHNRDADHSKQRAKIQTTFHKLNANARLSLRRHTEEALCRMPGPELLAMLEAHASQLAEAARFSLEQATQMIEIAQEDLDAWERDCDRALTRFHETLVLRIMEAVNRTINEHGRHFARSDVWQQFDEKEAQKIARQTVDEFLNEQRDVLADKEKRLHLFARNMDHCMKTCLATAMAALSGLENQGGGLLRGDNGVATYFLVQTHHYMKQLATLSGGVALGRLSAVGPLALFISAGNVLALSIASPMIAVVVAAMAGTAGVLYHLGREDKRRAAFVERRRQEAEQYADRITELLRAELDKARQSVTDLYAGEIRTGFSPTLESLFHQSAHLRLFLDTMYSIRNNTVQKEEDGLKQLEDLSQNLINKGLVQ